MELEHELKGKLIQLRERFLATQGDARKVTELMVQTLSTFLVLFKNTLRLYNENPPIQKMQALEKLHQHIAFDLEIFQLIGSLKEGKKISNIDPMTLFQRYLTTLEMVVEHVDQFIHK
jgi:hypothetical protein